MAHSALNALAEFDPGNARVIELRFFGDTVLRDWKLGRAWLLSELSGKP